MRKRLFTPTPRGIRPTDEGWLDLDRCASVEITSEEKDYEIESALVSGESQGWRAANPGTQTIRLLFDQPQKVRRISLVFEDAETARTQEFVLRWSPDDGRSFREIVRQQWNFNPPNTTREIEEYNVQLSDVTVLELIIVPDISRGTARASLRSLRLSWTAAIRHSHRHVIDALPFDRCSAYVGYWDGMDVERTIDDIEQLQEMFEAPDIRPLGASGISTDGTLAHSPWFRLWQHYGICCRSESPQLRLDEIEG
jgi:hypothetical protein